MINNILTNMATAFSDVLQTNSLIIQYPEIIKS